MHSQLARIRAALGDTEVLLLTDPISVRYASGFALTDGAALIGREEAWLITDSRYEEAARAAVADMQILLADAATPLRAHLGALLQRLAPASLGAEAARMSHADWDRLQTALGVPFHAADRILADLRASKTEEELACLIEAQRISERALDDILGLLRPGLTEQQVAAELVYRLYKYGGEANSFDPIVVTGSKTSLPHGVPGGNVIAPGDFVTMDFGTMKNGYCSDMTRTVAIGSADDEMRRVYSVVAEAQLAGIEAAHAGVRGCDVDAAARRVIERAGYGAYFGHSFGHSLGLEIHESPNASPRCEEPLPPGAVISAEPGIYLPGRFGVRIEDVLWLGPNGTVNITRAPKQLLVL